MQRLDGTPIFSASDLVGFLECGHLTQLGLADSIHKPRRRPDWPDAELLEERYEAFREAG